MRKGPLSFSSALAGSLLLLAIIAGCDSNSSIGRDKDFTAPALPKPSLSNLVIQGLEVDLKPAFDPEIYHYAVQCGDGDNFSVAFEATDTTTTKINKAVADDNQVTFENLSIRDDIVIDLLRGSRSETYYLHCTSSSFPEMTITERSSSVDEGFLIIAPRMSGGSYLFIIDNNAVPRFRRFVEGLVTDFKRHADGRYSYAQRTERNEFGIWDSEIVILDSSLVEERRVRTVGLNQTDNHDFLITEEGTYMLMSYNSERRDLREYGLAEDELTRDSVIQEQTQSGDVVFEWNSWDHIDIDDCLNHRFPDDYAHINSIQVAPDGDIIASLRGCSSVVKIDRSSAETIWQLGGFSSDLTIVGDPYAEFCGQHTATLGSDNSLLLFDNGGHCNGERELTFGNFSRAVAYDIDETAEQAAFTRDYSYNGSYSEYTSSGGSVFKTRNGNWLISWAKGISDITEIAPDNSIALRLEVSDGTDKLRVYRAYREYDLDLPIRVNGETEFISFSD
jgi:hypothetical protein